SCAIVYVITHVHFFLLVTSATTAYLTLSLHDALPICQLIADPSMNGIVATLTFWALFLAFAIKTPLFPFHSWLPLAHTEAPASGSAILAGILVELGAYGFIRFALQMTPGAFKEYAGIIMAVAVFSVVYGALVAMAQTDLKRMVAYTSINHMGYLVFGVAVAALAPQASGGHAL